LLIGSYGLVAIENMALGKPVICYINEKMKEKYPSELPIISCGIENIKEKIEYLIKNQDALKTIGLNGRKYVEKYHDINKLNYGIVKIYEEI
jgi:glycosyltransferase involved in cell wall biosynthesis